MRYREPAAQSAELLRLVLPQVARHGGHYYPTTYAVWYEYLAGGNLSLAKDIGHRLEAGETLTQPDIEKLYELHIDTHNSHRVEQLQVGLGNLLRKLADLAATSGEGAAEYARTLTECESELQKITDVESMGRLVSTLLASTTSVRHSTEALRSELTATRDEMQALRDQMGTLQNEAVTDPLTGLRNRRGFDRSLEELCANTPDALSSSAVMIADIDHFKRVNDSYGHLFGDQVIRTAAQALKSVLKGRDIVARFGGEEFIILLPSTPESGAFALAEQLRATFAKGRIRRANSDEFIDKVTISIGVAVPAPGETIEQAIERADKALYQAKQEGRNCVRVAA
jgi:diguanylate cyclase